MPPPQQGLFDRLIERINPHFAILFLLPWFLFLINPNWMFQGFGHMDPWYYFGLSIDFPRYQHLGTQYSAERLTWILPARLFVALLSPVYGWLAFHVCVYCISTFSLYSIVRRLFDAQTAILTATMMGCHSMFIGSNGWTYVDSGSIAYLLLAFAALTSVRGARHPSAYVIFAGIFWAAAAYTYPLWWILTPCCALFYWGVVDGDSGAKPSFKFRLSRYLLNVAFFSLGLVVTTSLMMFCHYCVHGSGGGFFFAQNLAMINFHLTVKQEEVYWGSNSYAWVKTAGWIVFPVLTMVATILALLRYMLRKIRLTRPVIGICAAFGYAFLSLLYLQFRNTHVLEFDYYVSILIPLEFLVLAALVYRVPPRVAGRTLYLILAVSSLIMIIPLLRARFHNIEPDDSLIVYYILGVAVVGVSLFWRHVRTWAWVVIGLAVTSFGLLPAYPSSAWRSAFNGLAATRRVAEAVNVVDSSASGDKLPVFWIDDFNDANTFEYRSIMCALQTHGSSMWKYPAVDTTKHYPAGTELILITRDKNVFESANATMRGSGMPLRMWKQQLISGEGENPSKPVSYWLTFTDVLAPGPSAMTSTAPQSEALEVVPGALNLSGILPMPTPGVSVKAGPPVRIATATQNWAYAAYAVLPFTATDQSKARLRMSVKVLSGKVAFGILNASETGFLTRVTIGPSDAFQDITLEIEHPEDSRKMVIQNETPEGQRGEVLVSRIELLAYPSSMVSKRLSPKAQPKTVKAAQGR
jgi:hypothetical protein